jgi:hypothetical protein
MSDRTAPALARLDALLPLLKALPPSPVVTELNETAEALRRAVAAFHMEAIRFRMYGVDRLLKTHGTPEARSVFDDLRHALEEAGFHTRSHAAPDKA